MDPVRDPLNVALGAVAREARESAGKTQAEMGEAIGKHKATLSALERGTHSFTMPIFVRFSEAVKVQAPTLLFKALARLPRKR